ncbi:hypothetical protein WH47_09869 [Habropoda laboriosa]|uniref:Coiled-coil domain-containing protein 112 n=1 Tax=Habropoda laboriosa TaxID=597456 RepID=A0A0L7R331_9HYME|nr:hypothetical protein WH47_09869 [Habropoda laboriosa]
MQDFEKFCPIQTLMQEKDNLNTELQEFTSNLTKFENAQKNATLSSLTCQTKIENKKKKVEYQDVDDFHALVVATDLSAETIINHETWYKHYQSLREKQKAAVKEWRQLKELEKKKNIDEMDKEVENCHEEDCPIEIEEEKKIDILKKSKTSRAESRSTNSSADSNKSEKKELIKKWKMEKENKHSMDEEQVKMQMKLKKEIEENRKKVRREKIQKALEEYKKKKSLENTLKEQNEHLREKYKYDATLLKAFRKQDEEFTQKRKDLISRKKNRSKSETVDMKRVELAETRDYSTLLNTTKVWREKCRSEDLTKHINEFHYIKDIPRT